MAEVKRSAEFVAWIDKLKDLLARARILARVDRLSLGLWGDHKVIDPGLVELRCDFGPGYRVYILRDGDEYIVLLCGGDKSSQTKDIERAREIAQVWREEIAKEKANGK